MQELKDAIITFVNESSTSVSDTWLSFIEFLSNRTEPCVSFATWNLWTAECAIDATKARVIDFISSLGNFIYGALYLFEGMCFVLQDNIVLSPQWLAKWLLYFKNQVTV